MDKVRVIGIGSKGREAIKNLSGRGFRDIALIIVEENSIESLLGNVDLVLIVAGMVNDSEAEVFSSIARKSRELNVLSVAIVSKVGSNFERLRKLVDAVVVASDERGFFDLVHQVVTGIEKVFIEPGFIHLCLSDARDLVCNSGTLFVGFGKSEGENRGLIAAEKALRNELIENAHIENASKIAVKVIGGEDLSLDEAYKSAKLIKEKASRSERFLLGIGIDEKMKGTLQVVVIATIPNW